MKIDIKIYIFGIKLIMEDNVRAFDNNFTDQLIDDNFSDEEDPILRVALHESIKSWKSEKKYSREIERLKKESLIKEQQKKEEEIRRIEELREKLGILISRLKTVFKNDKVAHDLLKWIDWECTPTHELQSLRPYTETSIQEMKDWIVKNLSPTMIRLIEGLSFY
jgi:hypothetical protein